MLLDHDLPGMSGLEMLTRMRAADAGMCVVMMSGCGGPDRAAQALEAGAAELRSKPLVLPEARQLLERLIGPGYPPSPG